LAILYLILPAGVLWGYFTIGYQYF